MSLLDPLNKVFNVANEPVADDGRAVGVVNLERFRNAINRMRPPAMPGVVNPINDHRRGTLYVPPGFYIISRATDIADNWRINFTEPPGPMENRVANLDARRSNPFGASVVFPEGTTLWLAPGAVLAPARGCVIDVSSLLVCEETKCFDLSLGGLVVFGQAVPVLRPEWWGAVSGEEASAPIQAAIDAAIHNRSATWPTGPRPPAGVVPYQVRSRPPLVVELRGTYRVARTINVRADSPTNGVVSQHETGTPPVAPSGVRAGEINAKAIVRGSWEGSRRRGATLLADGELGENPMLRLTACAGITIQAITFLSQRSDYQPGLEIRATSSTEIALHGPSQDITIRSCAFAGSARPLVQVGARTVIHPADPPRINTPFVDPASEAGVDLVLLSFDECDFTVSGGLPGERSVGIDVRAGNSLPIRYRRCEFSGNAAAMMSLWNATHYLEGCRFANSRAPSGLALADTASNLRGLEEPDGSDIFLRAEYPWLFEESRVPQAFLEAPRTFPLERLPSWPGHVLLRPQTELIPGMLALGCVSHSPQFLSSVTPTTGLEGQETQWPTVLVNTRHRAPVSATAPSVRWGLINVHSAASQGDPLKRDMNRGGPLALIGGSFSNYILFLRGACQGAAVGVRVRTGVPNGIRIESEGYPTAAWPSTAVFGLPKDQR